MQTLDEKTQMEELKNPCLNCKDKKWFCNWNCTRYGEYHTFLEDVYKKLRRENGAMLR